MSHRVEMRQWAREHVPPVPGIGLVHVGKGIWRKPVCRTATLVEVLAFVRASWLPGFIAFKHDRPVIAWAPFFAVSGLDEPRVVRPQSAAVKRLATEILRRQKQSHEALRKRAK